MQLHFVITLGRLDRSSYLISHISRARSFFSMVILLIRSRTCCTAISSPNHSRPSSNDYVLVFIPYIKNFIKHIYDDIWKVRSSHFKIWKESHSNLSKYTTGTIILTTAPLLPPAKDPAISLVIHYFAPFFALEFLEVSLLFL